MLLIVDKSVALRPFKAIKNLEHCSKPLKSFLQRRYFNRGYLLLNQTEVVRHLLAVLYHVKEVLLLEDACTAFWRDLLKILLNIVNLIVALSEQVAPLVNVSLHEERLDELVEAFDFVV